MSPEYDALRQIQSKHVPTLKAEIGAVLKAARLKKGLALEAVARQTRIPKRYLEALEADRFEEFPALVYLRGFLKGYCEFLETAFDPLWSQVEAATVPPAPAAAGAASTPAAPAPGDAEPAARAPAPVAAAKDKPEPPRAPAHHAPAHGSAHSGGGGGGAAGAIVFSLLLAGGLGYWLFTHQQPAAPAPVPEPPKALQPLKRMADPVFLLRLVDDAWLQVSLDGQPVFEGRAPRGSTQEWKPQKSLSVRTTSPEAVQLELDGAAHPLGAPGPDGAYRFDIP